MVKVKTYTEQELWGGYEPPRKRKSLNSYIESRSITIPAARIPRPHVKDEKTLQAGVTPALRKVSPAVMRVAVGLNVAGDHAVASPLKDWPDNVFALPPDGRMVGIELKVPGKQIRCSQLARLKDIIRAGGIAGVITSMDGLDEFLAGERPIFWIDDLPSGDGYHIGVW